MSLQSLGNSDCKVSFNIGWLQIIIIINFLWSAYLRKCFLCWDCWNGEVVYLCIIFVSMHSIFALPGWRHKCILKKDGVSHFGLVYVTLFLVFVRLLIYCVYTKILMKKRDQVRLNIKNAEQSERKVLQMQFKKLRNQL